MSRIHNQIGSRESPMSDHYFIINIICTQILDKTHLPTSEHWIRLGLKGKKHFILPLEFPSKTYGCSYVYEATIEAQWHATHNLGFGVKYKGHSFFVVLI